MKRNTLILLLLTIFFAAIALTSFVYFAVSTISVIEYDMHIKVEETRKIGINVDADKVWFGSTGPGGSSSRLLLLTNNNDFPVIVKLFFYGKLGEYVVASENPVSLEPKTQKEISLTAILPSDIKPGEYTGKVRAVFIRKF